MLLAGRDPAGGLKWAGLMREAGFEDVTERRILSPINPWAKGSKTKMIGTVNCQNLSEGIESISKAMFSRILGWSNERIEVFLAGVRTDLRNKSIHGYGVVNFVYGRKPGA